jgi:hypothetical protein
MRVRWKPTTPEGPDEPELPHRVMPHQKTERRFGAPSEHLVQPAVRRTASGDPAPIDLLELVASNGVGEEVREVRKQVERVPLDERADASGRVLARCPSTTRVYRDVVPPSVSSTLP